MLSVLIFSKAGDTLSPDPSQPCPRALRPCATPTQGFPSYVCRHTACRSYPADCPARLRAAQRAACPAAAGRGDGSRRSDMPCRHTAYIPHAPVVPCCHCPARLRESQRAACPAAAGRDAAMQRGDGSRRIDAARLPAHTAVMSRGALPGSQLQHTCAAHPAEVRASLLSSACPFKLMLGGFSTGVHGHTEYPRVTIWYKKHYKP